MVGAPLATGRMRPLCCYFMSVSRDNRPFIENLYTNVSSSRSGRAKDCIVLLSVDLSGRFSGLAHACAPHQLI